MVSFAQFQIREGSPIYLQILRYVKAGIAAGTVADGDELPSRRVLSALLGVNPNTIQKAFRQLEDEGLLLSHAGAKSLIAAPPEKVESLRRELPAWGAAEFVEQMKALGVTRAEALKLVEMLWEEDPNA